ncbi:hypothetical protein BJ875DRAFT_530134 [Amylocarpus encephaloides]|uniref:Uncharacterized protein n=1 Tax=Amylocarpus encephaloides TaxID=45428 RepID=A0A9P8C6A1_9HELO|nr:hypothetical protein BJ875DRAFT_530134 [Amylocarpus encephaloides]
MKSPISDLCLSFLLICNIQSICAYRLLPVPTSLQSSASRLWIDDGSPAPTEAPRIEELRIREKAQKTEMLLAAKNNVCGYVNGSSDQPWGCSLSSTCIFSTPAPIPTNTANSSAPNGNDNSTHHAPISGREEGGGVGAGGVLCCDEERGCPAEPAPTACVDRGKYDYNSTCTGSCSTDPSTLKCTEGIYLYCATLHFDKPRIEALYCDYLSTYPPSPPTADPAPSFPTIVNKFFTYTPPPSNATRSSSATGKFTTTGSGKVGGGGGGGEKGKVNGALVGGVVGGLVVVGMVAGAGWFFWRKRKGNSSKGKGKAIAQGSPEGKKKLVR